MLTSRFPPHPGDTTTPPDGSSRFVTWEAHWRGLSSLSLYPTLQTPPVPAATFCSTRSPQAPSFHAHPPSPARDPNNPDNPHTLPLSPRTISLLDFLGATARFVVSAAPSASTGTAALVLPFPGVTAAGVSLCRFALTAVLVLLSCGSCN